MAASKIAPTLARVVLPRFRHSQERYLSDEDAPVAAREFRALLRVARATRRLLHRGNYRMPYEMWSDLVDADAALSRASGARSRKGARRG